MLFRDGRPWVVAGSMGGDAQPQIHAQVVSALVDGGVDVATAVGAPRWFVEPEEHFASPVDVRPEPRFAPGIAQALRDLGHPLTEIDAFDSSVGHCHAIELVAGGPAARTARWPPRPTLGARACRPSGDPPCRRATASLSRLAACTNAADGPFFRM